MTKSHSGHDGVAFFQALLKQVGEGCQTPKFQVERAIGPILGIFIEDAMRSLLGAGVHLIAAEFPLKKGNNQSSNIDWLLYDSDSRKLIFLELKTDRSSFRHGQLANYLEKGSAADRLWQKLRSDLECIQASTKKKEKYKAYLDGIDRIVDRLSEGGQGRIGFSPVGVKVVYLAPARCTPDQDAVSRAGLSFESFVFDDLPAEIRGYNEYWKLLRQFLVKLQLPPDSAQAVGA